MTDEQRPRRTIGIIGGLGPQATVDLFAKIVAATPVREERDHLHIIIDNDPDVPNRHDAICGRGPSAAPKLQQVARNLERAGADVLVMPCNTAHAFAQEIRNAVSIPFLSIVDVTSGAVAQAVPRGSRIGLLAAEGCLQAGLYQSALKERGLQAVALDGEELDRFMRVVFAIKIEGKSRAASEEMERLLDHLRGKGCAAIVAACTEVPVAIDCAAYDFPIFDSTALLAQAAVDYAIGENRSRP